jgi:excisionase family DNA binding protein
MELFTIEEVAEIMDVHPESVRRWIRRGELRGFKPGGKLLKVRRTDLEEFIKDAEREPTTQR